MSFSGELKDYDVKIIDYRGGKALLIDSFDIALLSNGIDENPVLESIKNQIENVDYILVLTTYPLSMIRKEIRDYLFVIAKVDSINCYRWTTPRGRKTIRKWAEKMREDLFKSIKKMVA